MYKSDIEGEFAKKIGKISRQSSVFVAGNVFTVVAGWFFKIYVARTVGASALGVFSLGLTVVSLFTVFGNLGIPTTLARFIPAYQAQKESHKIRQLLVQGLTVFIVLNVALAGLMISQNTFIATTLYNEITLKKYLPAFAVLLVLNQLIQFFGEGLRGYQEVIRRTIVTNFLRFAFRFSTTVVLFWAGWRLWGYIAAELVAAAICSFVLAGVLWRLLPSNHTPPPSNVKAFRRDTIMFSASIMGMHFLNFLSLQSDKVFVGMYLTSADVGIYAVAFAVATYLSTGLQGVNSILGPIITELSTREDFTLLERIFRTVTKWMLGLTWPLGVGMILYHGSFMRVFGGDFESGGTSLAILASGQIVSVVAGSAGMVLIMSGRQQLEIFANFVNVIIMIPLYLILIPRFGIAGAAISVTVGKVAINLLRLWLLRSRMGILPYNKESLRILPAIIASTLVLVCFRQFTSLETSISIALLAVASSYVAFLIATFFLGLSSDDRILLAAALRTLKKAFAIT